MEITRFGKTGMKVSKLYARLHDLWFDQMARMGAR